MKVGFLTGCVVDRSFTEVVELAAGLGFDSLEVAVGPGSRHIDTAALVAEGPAAISRVRKQLDSAGIEISSLAFYANLTEADPDRRAATSAYFRSVTQVCADLGVGVACILAGFPVPGKDKFRCLREDFADVVGPLTDYAEGLGVKVAMENYFATLIQGLAHWDAAFEAVPSPNLGLNFDPSHLYWQGIDYLGAVDRYAKRIFHTHAKDCLVKHEVVRHRGILEGGWWSYVIPGYGGVDWPKYVAYLRRIGYDGVLSIEHEDDSFSPDEGLEKGLRFLRNWA